MYVQTAASCYVSRLGPSLRPHTLRRYTLCTDTLVSRQFPTSWIAVWPLIPSTSAGQIACSPTTTRPFSHSPADRKQLDNGPTLAHPYSPPQSSTSTSPHRRRSPRPLGHRTLPLRWWSRPQLHRSPRPRRRRFEWHGGPRRVGAAGSRKERLRLLCFVLDPSLGRVRAKSIDRNDALLSLTVIPAHGHQLEPLLAADVPRDFLAPRTLPLRPTVLPSSSPPSSSSP